MSSATSQALARASATGLSGYGAIESSSFSHDTSDASDYADDYASFNATDKSVTQDKHESSNYHDEQSEYHDSYQSDDFSGQTHRGAGHELSTEHEDGFRQVKYYGTPTSGATCTSSVPEDDKLPCNQTASASSSSSATSTAEAKSSATTYGSYRRARRSASPIL